MSYLNGFVMSIVKDGSAVREEKRKVVLPFESEYAVKLHNKNNRTAVCDLFINGDDVSEGGFVVHANSFVNIERFLGGNLNSGKRFKFAKLSSPQVKDKDNFENGVVEARFRLVKDNLLWITATTCTGNLKNTLDTGDFVYDGGIMSQCNYTCSTLQEGATVEGSNSDQSFIYTDVGELEENITSIKIKIMSDGSIEVKQKYCTKCGRRKRFKDIYCAKCGRKLI